MEGIIYKVQPYLEHDRLLFVYSPKGKVTLIAKGSQKLTSTSRILSQFLTRITFKETDGKSMYILQDAEMMNDYPSIKRDYNQLEYAASILSMVDSCVSENDDHESIFKDLVEVLEHFQKELVIAFGFRLGKRLGYPLSLKPDGRIVKGFNIERGGLIYQGESLSVDLDLNLTTILLKLIHLSYDTIEKIDEINFIKLKMCLVKYYEYHLDIRLKHI